MAGSLGTLGRATVEIAAPTGKLDKDLKHAEGAVKNSVSQMANAFKAIGATVVAAGITKFIKDSIKAFTVQENAVAQLEARLKSTKGVVGLTSKELQKMAAGLQGVTTYGDEAIIGMQSLLLTFTSIGRDVFPQATEAILNVATAMGTDLKSAAVQVGKALNDPILGVTALARSGIQFTQAQKDMIKSLTESGKILDAQTIILKELETQFGGAARAARDTFGGETQSLSNAFGDTMETIGGVIARITQPHIKALSEEITALNNAMAGTSTASITLDLIATDKELLNAKKHLDELGNSFVLGAADADAARIQLINLISRLEEHRAALTKDNDAMAESNKRIAEIQTRLNQLSTAPMDFFEQMEFARLADDLKKLGSAFKELEAPLKPFILPESPELSIAPSVDATNAIQKMIDLQSTLGEVTELANRKFVDFGYVALTAFQQIERLGVSAANALASVFANWATDTKKNFGDVAEAFGQMLIQMVADLLARYAIFAIFSFLPGGGGIASALAAASGFKPIGKADGGFIPGSGNRDSVPIMATPGEFVVNKWASRKFATLLEFINSGMLTNRFSDGGLVNAGSSALGFAGAGNFSPNINVGQPAIYVTLDGQAIRSYVRREDAYDRRSRA